MFLGVIYLAIRLVYEFLKRQTGKPVFLYYLQQGLFRLIQLYEIIVFLILGSILIFINPVLHGVILLAIVVFGFSHIRNYVSGRLVLLDDNLSVGKRLKVGQIKGVIVKLGLFDIQIRTALGISFVNYVRLFQEGYSLIDVEEIGGFYEFELKPVANSTQKNHIQHLKDAFFSLHLLHNWLVGCMVGWFLSSILKILSDHLKDALFSLHLLLNWLVGWFVG